MPRRRFTWRMLSLGLALALFATGRADAGLILDPNGSSGSGATIAPSPLATSANVAVGQYNNTVFYVPVNATAFSDAVTGAGPLSMTFQHSGNFDSSHLNGSSVALDDNLVLVVRNDAPGRIQSVSINLTSPGTFLDGPVLGGAYTSGVPSVSATIPASGAGQATSFTYTFDTPLARGSSYAFFLPVYVPVSFGRMMSISSVGVTQSVTFARSNLGIAAVPEPATIAGAAWAAAVLVGAAWWRRRAG